MFCLFYELRSDEVYKLHKYKCACRKPLPFLLSLTEYSSPISTYIVSTFFWLCKTVNLYSYILYIIRKYLHSGQTMTCCLYEYENVISRENVIWAGEDDNDNSKRESIELLQLTAHVPHKEITSHRAHLSRHGRRHRCCCCRYSWALWSGVALAAVAKALLAEFGVLAAASALLEPAAVGTQGVAGSPDTRALPSFTTHPALPPIRGENTQFLYVCYMIMQSAWNLEIVDYKLNVLDIPYTVIKHYYSNNYIFIISVYTFLIFAIVCSNFETPQLRSRQLVVLEIRPYLNEKIVGK